MESLARNFLNEIKQHPSPFEFLCNLVSIKRTETGWLEFKSPFYNDPGDERLKAAWSEALAGFANTNDGVLIWGIHAKKNDEGVDCAQSVTLIENPAAFRTRLSELARHATDPPLPGDLPIEFFSGPDDRGFVVALIHQSPWRPHKACNGQNRYPIRSNDSFFEAARSFLQILFYPESKAILSMEARGMKRYQCEIVLTNRGTSSAYDVYLKNTFDFPMYGHCWAADNDISLKGYLLRQPLHPGQEVAVHFFDYCNDIKDVLFDSTFEIFCRNQSPTVLRLRILDDNLLVKGEIVKGTPAL